MRFSTSLKNNFEFRRLYYKGRSAAGPLLVLYARPNRRGENRLGITVGTKLGGAVTRNRVRRRLREIYRLNEEKFVRGTDIVAVARTRSVTSAYRELEREFLRLAGKVGALEEKA